MVKMTEESRNFLKENLPEVVDAVEPNDILDPLYDLIMYKGFITFEKGYNEFGHLAQDVYDDIFYSNFSD